MNTNNARLTRTEVQNIRDLLRSGFNQTAISRAYGVCSRTVKDIYRNRSWCSIPNIPAPLPLLPIHAALLLRLRSFRRLTQEERQTIEQYAQHIAAQVKVKAERETVATELVTAWKPIGPTRWPKPAETSGATEQEGAVHNF